MKMTEYAGEKMENKNNFTNRLIKIVKQRKTSTVVIKQDEGYKSNRRINKSLSHDSYSYFDE